MSLLLSTSTNEHGILEGHFKCRTCGAPFTVTPCPINPEKWPNCLAPDCASYELSRDLDRYFDDGNVLSFEARRNPGALDRILAGNSRGEAETAPESA